MVADDWLVKNFENQIKVLTKLQERIEESIETANQQLGRLKSGEPVEDIFGVASKRSPTPQAGGAKGHQ